MIRHIGWGHSFFLIFVIQSALSFGMRCDFAPMAPSKGDLFYSPVAGALMGLSGKEESTRRTGILIRTDKGRDVFLVSRFMASAGHHGMNEFLSQHLPSGEKLADILWSGELRLERNPLNSSQPQITEINTTSGFAAEWFRKQRRDPSENKSQHLLEALRKTHPELVAENAKAKNFDPNDPKQDEHLDPFMSDYVRKMKALRGAERDAAVAKWEAGGKVGPKPEGRTPNFRHDIKEMIDPLSSSLSLIEMVSKMPPNPRMETAKKDSLAMVRKYAPSVMEFMRLLAEDGVKIREGDVDHMERARLGLSQLNTTGNVSGMTMADLMKSFRAVNDRYNKLGIVKDGKDAATNPNERSLLPENVQIIQLAPPSR